MFSNDKAKFERWYESNKHVHAMVIRHQSGHGVDRWFDCQCPPYRRDTLPGGAMAITMSPDVEIAHEAISGLHGLVTALTGVPHDPKTPVFSLFNPPGTSGWACYIASDELAKQMAKSERNGHIWGHEVAVRFGPLFRFRCPPTPEPRAHDIRVDTISPLVIRASLRNGQHRTYTDLQASNLVSTLGAWTPRRILADGFSGNLSIVLLGKQTNVVTQPIGGTRNPVLSVTGSFWLRVNAPTLWLLRVAERIGLGGRTAFGFGRIRIEAA